MRVKGYRAGAVKAGIRYQDRLDLGLIYSEVPAVAAGVFTTNRVKAAPVLIDIERLGQGKTQAVLVNSGIANACCGEQGMKAALESSALLGRQLNIPENLIQLASTGVIGQQLDVGKIRDALPALVESLSPDGFDDVARAIMTTDTVPKTSGRTIMIGEKEVSLFGIAKGSGMIMPDMATMLCFVMTDAQIVFPELKAIVHNGVEKSFNRITVDGDTSTNDMVLVMANGAAENPWIDEENEEGRAVFAVALNALLKDLATQIVADGEGATKQVTIRVQGAREVDEAMDAAQTIANSALVKTAFYGEDPNWGRIMAALGRSSCHFSPDRVDIYFDEVLVAKNGVVRGGNWEEEAAAVLRKDRFFVTVDLHEGLETAEVYTCDFSLDYVKINAAYRS